MMPTPLTLPVLQKLLPESIPQRQALIKIYNRIPETHCQRRTHCCSLLPEMTFLEALPIIEQMMQAPSSVRENQIQKLIRYFFTNPLEITACPFLQGKDCTIYADRFFGCRAYGLWSEDYYRGLLEQSRQGKSVLQRQWQNMGVTLPKEVVAFNLPYCRLVQTESRVSAFDALLLTAWEDMEKLSQTLNPWHRLFGEQSFSDMSFFVAGLVYGPLKAVGLKVRVVRDIIQKKDWKGLEEVMQAITDPFG
jgi:Fe-S-cluster containining protein